MLHNFKRTAMASGLYHEVQWNLEKAGEVHIQAPVDGCPHELVIHLTQGIVTALSSC